MHDNDIKCKIETFKKMYGIQRVVLFFYRVAGQRNNGNDEDEETCLRRDRYLFPTLFATASFLMSKEDFCN